MSFIITTLHDKDSFPIEEQESILQAALRAEKNFPYGCRSGNCGACQGRVVAGEFYYPDGSPDGLSDSAQQQQQALFCQARALTDLQIEIDLSRLTTATAPRKLPCRVEKIERFNADILCLYLKLPKTESLQFSPGQHIDILFGENMRRSFSIANAPHDNTLLELHIRHYDGGAFSEYAFSTLTEKTLLRLEGPLGSFGLQAGSQRPVIMIAGGTGFAPIKSMLETLLRDGLTQPVYFYWGVRSSVDLYLNDLVASWLDEAPLLHYVPVLSDPADDINWLGRTGWVHEAVLADHPDLTQFEVYTCGPPPMVSAVLEQFTARGLDPAQIHSDAFEFAKSSL